MQHIQILSRQNNEILFAGNFLSLRDALEQAVKDNTDLSYAALQNANLQNANIDDAKLPFADLGGANLSGANLSESNLFGANLMGEALYNTCLSLSDLRHTNFINAAFGATDINGCDISFARFSRHTAAHLDFATAHHMRDCHFIGEDGQTDQSSQPPLVIKGLLRRPIVIFNHPALTRIHNTKEKQHNNLNFIKLNLNLI